MLSAAIIEPLQDVLKRPVRHLVFVPSSSLARFPFALLSTPESSIVFDYTVSQSPSLLIFLELLRRPKVSADIRLSAIANPNVEVRDAYGEVLPPLPFAGFEAMYVAKVFGGYPRLSDGLDGPQLKTLFEECDILHLAAHGELNSEQPLLSMLHLESSFTVVDLANSRCDARLVVFSACVSGLGRITFGDDLLGFSHAVLHSGARAFIGTLWDTDDLASMLFMMMFYKFIKGIGVEAPKSPAVALQQAQRGLIDMDVPDRNLLLREILEMLEDVDYDSSIRAMALKNKPSLEEALAGDNCDFSEPYFWAPFVLVGLGIESIYSPKV
jgi:CHAT domain-containing protein